MEREEFEFLISQYFDGGLSEKDRKAVEEKVRDDAEAQRALKEYDILRGTVGAPLPAMRWERLAQQISGHIVDNTREDNRLEESAPPVYSMGIFRDFLRLGLALAASALIAFGVARWATRLPGTPAVLSVVGPQAEAATGDGVIDIDVGEPQEAATAMAYIYNENVLANQAVVALDSVGDSQLRQIH
jgi:anti-sigma factor RsiW